MKTKKVLFLFANNSVKNGLADPQALAELMNRAVENRGDDMEIFVSYARSLSFFISNGKNVIRDHRNHMDLSDYDFVYFRKAGSCMQQMLTCALYLNDRQIPFYDSEIGKSNSRNKLSQMYILQRQSIPVPKTLYCRNNRRLARLVEKGYADDFGFPLIAKATGGTRGDANYLVQTLDELKNIITTEKRHFLIQEFIPNDGDLRMFVVGGVLKGVIRRRAVGDSHLNNTSKGGSAEIVESSQFSMNVKNDALGAALAFGRDCAGVDVIFNKENGKHYILEVNRAPQIEGSSFQMEKANWLADAIQSSIANYQRSGDALPNTVFGRFESVHIMMSDNVENRLVAKVDTGADSSSLHAVDIDVTGGVLSCRIAGEKMTFSDFADRKVRSSNGIWQHRYLIELPVRIGKVIYAMKVTLNDRSGMNYDMLIGRRFLRANKLYVDVSRRFIASNAQKRSAK